MQDDTPVIPTPVISEGAASSQSQQQQQQKIKKRSYNRKRGVSGNLSHQSGSRDGDGRQDGPRQDRQHQRRPQIGRASCRERV